MLYISVLLTSFIQSLIEWDHQLLLAINGWHAPWADWVMWYASKSTVWIPLYVLLVVLLAWRVFSPARHFSWRALRAVGVLPRAVCLRRVLLLVCVLAAFGIATGAADYISSGIIKHAVCRFRPTQNPHLAHLVHIVNGYRGGRYGFVSSHAANTMACALLFSLLYKNWKATVGLMSWVALNCYSRMYLGVHYPSDIVGGLIVGAATALLVYWVLNRWVLPAVRRGEASDRKAAADGEAPADGGSGTAQTAQP